MGKKNLRRVSVLVTAQTLKNLQRLANMSGYNELGLVIDKLTREKMLSLREPELSSVLQVGAVHRLF